MFSAIFLAKSILCYGSSCFCQNVLFFFNLYVIWPFVNQLMACCGNVFVQNMDFLWFHVGRLFFELNLNVLCLWKDNLKFSAVWTIQFLINCAFLSLNFLVLLFPNLSKTLMGNQCNNIKLRNLKRRRIFIYLFTYLPFYKRLSWNTVIQNIDKS